MTREERLEKRRVAYQAKREHHLAYAAAYRAQNPDKVRAATARWREANADEVLAYSRRYYWENHEQQLAAMKAWRESNRGVHRQHALKRYYADVEAGRDKCRTYRASNVEHHRARVRLWLKANPERMRDLARRRRARKLDATVEAFAETQVFERDGWRCYICDEPVRRDVPTQAPNKAVLEHIVPLARGGAHSLANTACACHRCNQMKGAHSTPEQVRERLERKTDSTRARLHQRLG